MKRIIAAALAAMLVLAGCGAGTSKTEGTALYYINAEGNELETMPYTLKEEKPEMAAQELTEAVQDESLLPADGHSILQNSVQIASCGVMDDTVHVDLSGDYGSMKNSNKLLLTAGLTKTFEQIPGIDQVAITIRQEPLLDSRGKELGTLTADDFVIHSGKEINVYTGAEMTLYFLDDKGNIVPETRMVYYNSSVPMEQVVLEELIKGPVETGHFAILSPDVNYINITIQEGICYVNFDENLFTLMQGYEIEKTLDAIVRSLASVCSVDKVQFSINGDTAIVIDGLSLDQIFEA